MTVEQLLNQIERRLTNNVTRNAAVNRYELRELLNENGDVKNIFGLTSTLLFSFT